MIGYLREENHVLREQLAGRRLGLEDDQRRRLAARAKRLGREWLADVATIVIPETWLPKKSGPLVWRAFCGTPRGYLIDIEFVTLCS
jgi:hypothetical protein